MNANEIAKALRHIANDKRMLKTFGAGITSKATLVLEAADLIEQQEAELSALKEAQRICANVGDVFVDAFGREWEITHITIYSDETIYHGRSKNGKTYSVCGSETDWHVKPAAPEGQKGV